MPTIKTINRECDKRMALKHAVVEYNENVYKYLQTLPAPRKKSKRERDRIERMRYIIDILINEVSNIKDVVTVPCGSADYPIYEKISYTDGTYLITQGLSSITLNQPKEVLPVEFRSKTVYCILPDGLYKGHIIKNIKSDLTYAHKFYVQLVENIETNEPINKKVSIYEIKDDNYEIDTKNRLFVGHNVFGTNDSLKASEAYESYKKNYVYGLCVCEPWFMVDKNGITRVIFDMKTQMDIIFVKFKDKPTECKAFTKNDVNTVLFDNPHKALDAYKKLSKGETNI